MQHPLEPGGAVDHGGFMLHRVHVGQGGNVDHSAPAKVLPVAGQNVHGAEGGAFQEVGNALAAQAGGQVIHQTVAAEEQLQLTNQYHQGDEVRRGIDGLEHLARLLALQGVQGQGHQDGQWEADDEADDAQQEGVLHQGPELHVVKEPGEILEAHPDGVAGQDGVAGHEVLEGDQHAVDGQVVEQEHHQNRRKDHDEVRGILLEIPQPLAQIRLLLLLPRRRGRGFACALHVFPPYQIDSDSENASIRFQKSPLS